VSIGETFYAATSLDIAARSARVGTLVISRAEVYAKCRDGIAVRIDVTSGRGTVKVLAGSSRVKKSAGLALTIGVAI